MKTCRVCKVEKGDWEFLLKRDIACMSCMITHLREDGEGYIRMANRIEKKRTQRVVLQEVTHA